MNDVVSTDEVHCKPLEEIAEVVDLGEAGRWLEIKDQRDANRACRVTHTAIHNYFQHEKRAEAGNPRRWFMLVRDAPEGPVGDVCLVVTPPGIELKNPDLFLLGVHVTGNCNRNPYPEFADQIESLSQEIGIEIVPNHMGTPVAPPPAP